MQMNKSLIALLLASLSLEAIYLICNKGTNDTFFLQQIPSHGSQHIQWLSRHSKVYSSLADYEKRKQIFNDNLQIIDSLNKKHEGKTTFGLNRFSDMTLEEFQQHLNPQPKVKLGENMRNLETQQQYSTNEIVKLPQSIDWWQLGKVTLVKD